MDDDVGNTNELESQLSSTHTEPFWTSYRLRLAILCSVGFVLALTHRADLSLAMVCMVNGTGNETDTQSTDRFNWNKELRGVILGSFFWGHVLFQIPSVWLVRRISATKIITAGTACVSLLTLVTPWCARFSAYLLVADRVLVGAGQATLVPATQIFFLHWAPPNERSRLLGIVFSGFNLGAALTFPVSGLLCSYGFDGGWPSIFYILGGAGVLWSGFWFFLSADTPARSRRISRQERFYLERSLESLPMTEVGVTSTPWRDIFCSFPVWVCLIAETAMASGLAMMLTQLPSYMEEVMEFNKVQNGLLLTAPFISSYLFINIGGWFSDKIITKALVSKLWTRRIVAALGYFGAAIFLLILSQLDATQRIVAMVILNLAFGCCGLQIITTIVNFPEICGKHVGVVMVIGSIFSGLAGIASTYVAGVVTKTETREEWMMAFIVISATYVLGGLIFCVFAKTDIQKWATRTEDFPI